MLSIRQGKNEFYSFRHRFQKSASTRTNHILLGREIEIRRRKFQASVLREVLRSNRQTVNQIKGLLELLLTFRTFVKLKESDRKRSFVSRRRLRELLTTDGEPFSAQESEEFWNFLDSVGGRVGDNVDYEDFVKKITEEALFNLQK